MQDSNREPNIVSGLNRDLFCPGCGYNLRGLFGETVRCPECGRESTTRELEIPAAVIRRTLSVLESSSAYSVLWLLTLLGMAFFAAFDRTFWNHAQDWLVRWLLFFLAVAAALAYSLFHSRRTCLSHPDWPAALIRYHVFGVLMFAGAIGLYAAFVWISTELSRRQRGSFANPLGLGGAWLVALIVLIVIVVFWARFTYRRATVRLRLLQRDLAVQIAQIEMERREILRR